MSDHADTIRRIANDWIGFKPEEEHRKRLLAGIDERLKAMEAERQQAAKEADQLRLGLQATQELLDSRTAERQQAIDARDELQAKLERYEDAVPLCDHIAKAEARCERAIDALREIAWIRHKDGAPSSLYHEADRVARAALVSLGETE